MVIDYDDIQTWAPLLGAHLQRLVPTDLQIQLQTAKPAYIEDALELVFSLADRCKVIAATLHWIAANSLVAYHGSRLTVEEATSIRELGSILFRYVIPALAHASDEEACPVGERRSCSSCA